MEELWQVILSSAATFNLFKAQKNSERTTESKSTASTPGDRPGDDYNRRATWSEVLEPYGWTQTPSYGDKTYWKRPDKPTPGHSATTGHCHSVNRGDLLYVFSSNGAPFEPNKGYSKFEAFAVLNHDGNFNRAAKILSAMGYGRKRQDESAKFSDNGKPEDKSKKRIWMLASSVPYRKIEWLWPDIIPLGKLTLFAGASCQGKTMVAMDIIGRVTCGTTWPDGREGSAPSKVIYITGDDDFNDTIVPRLIEVCADMDRVVFLEPAEQVAWTMKALEKLDLVVSENEDNVRLVVVDPPTSFMGDVDDHKNTELRPLLMTFGEWASRHRCAVILVTHLNKGVNLDAMSRVIGGVAWNTAVRATYLFAPDPDNETQSLMVCAKINNVAMPKARAYRIVNGTVAGRAEWLGEVDTSANDAIQGSGKPKHVVAAEWMIERFREQREWPAKDWKAAAREEGISDEALTKARKRLAVKMRREADQFGNIKWIWWVPSDWPYLTDVAEVDPQNGATAF